MRSPLSAIIARTPLALLALVASCSAADTQPPADASVAGDASSPGTDGSAARMCGPGVETVVADPPVIDPSSEMPSVRVSVRVRSLAAFPTSVAVNAVQPIRVALVRGETEVMMLATEAHTLPGSTVSAVWDGTLGGAPAPRGEYAIRVQYGCDAGPVPIVARVNVVRMGVTTVAIGDGDGARIPMLWHKLGGLASNYWLPPNDRPVLVRGSGAGASALNGDNGAATPFPAVATALDSPPLGPLGDAVESNYNLPFALSVGTRPDLIVGFGLDDGNATRPNVRARVTGASTEAAAVTDGGTVTYRVDDPPTPMLGRYDLPLRLVFEAERGDHSWVAFGGETVPLRAYGILGDQTVSPDHYEPYAPWLAIVDAVAGWVAKSTADPHAVAGIIVHHVNEELGLRYDIRNGASFYTEYRNAYDDALFDLTGFLDRSHGSTVNCSDCASIVSTYANMVGCDLGYSILTSNFALNYIRAIGTTTFTNDPFHRGAAGGFNYHAITSPISGNTDIFDATLDEDGDDHPNAAPFMDISADGLPRTFYLSHLSPVRVRLTHADKTSIE